jgi:sigma-B regulation protein RsbU (phosphoserine phosphatase)
VNVREKLLVLLAAVALFPLAILAIVEFTGTRVLADRQDVANRETVERDISRILSQNVQSDAHALGQAASIADLQARVQAAAVERALGAPGTIPAVLRGLRADDADDAIEARTVMLVDGRRWHVGQATAPDDGRSYSPSLALRDGNALVGSTSVVLNVLDLLRRDVGSGNAGGVTGRPTALEGVGRQITSRLVEPTPSFTLRVLARQPAGTATAWRAETNATFADDADEVQFGAIVSDLRAGRAGAARLAFGGADQLWIYAPVPALGAALLQVLPYDAVIDAARSAGGALRHEATQQIELSAIVALVMLAIVALVGALVAEAASRPIRDLALAVRRVGAGDFHARAPVRGSDELAALGEAFNAMVPRLEDGLRMYQSLELARLVQQSLLPVAAPLIGGFDIAGSSRYCDETGGDY